MFGGVLPIEPGGFGKIKPPEQSITITVDGDVVIQ